MKRNVTKRKVTTTTTKNAKKKKKKNEHFPTMLITICLWELL